MRLAASLMTWMAIATASAGAWAQGTDPVAAQELFREGRKAVQQGDYEAACPKFAESLRLEPAVGTRLNLADCDEHQGRLADALLNFRRALDELSPGDDRLGPVQTRIEALDKRVPRLTLRLEAPVAPQTTVRRDGVVLGAASLDVSLPINPGTHQVLVEAPGYHSRLYAVVLKETEVQALALRPGAKLPPPLPPRPASKPEPFRAEMRGAGSQSTVGYTLAGVGLASIGVGVVSALMLPGKKSTVQDHCDGQKTCDSTGLDAAHSGKTLWTVSMAAWGLGLASVGVGTVLVLTDDGKRPTTMVGPAMTPGGAGVSMVRVLP